MLRHVQYKSACGTSQQKLKIKTNKTAREQLEVGISYRQYQTIKF
jgi:hypothetical protein